MNKIKKLCTDPKGGCVFWSAGAQPPELLMSGEVVMATGWNGRFLMLNWRRCTNRSSLGCARS